VILIVAGWWRGACCSGCRKARCTRCPAEVAVHAADVAVAPQSEIVCAAIEGGAAAKPVFAADPNSYNLAEPGESVLVGTYKLVETRRISMLAEAKTAPNKDAETG
jgi:hypothetical protein